MAFLVKGIPLILQKIFAPLLGVVLAAWFIVLLVSVISGKRHSCRFSPTASGRDALPRVRSDRSVASPRRWPVWAGLAVLAVVCTTLCGKNTNGVQNVGGGHLFQFNPPLVQIVTPQDVSNGWRVAEETAAESFAPPTANAVTNEPWRRRGAHDDAFRIPIDGGWSYPYATGVTVLARGELRTNIRTHDFPRAFTQDISLLPLVNWSMLPEGRGESLFWHAATPSNTLLATWLNGALGRDATNPVSFQAELFPDGGFTYRYEDRTVRHARVWPFDWDNDGLENSVDPDPLTPGPDAHGTNAEWYNTVCSNVFSSVEGGGTGITGILPVDDVSALPWREGVNSNAYYFVDVVTESGPAPIYFTGDRDSRLGNPVVVANAFETNRVPLLIGIDYAITSPVPFAVSFPIDYMYPESLTNTPCTATVRWPLEFSVEPDGYGGFYTSVIPYDPGGVFQWGNGGTGGMRSGGMRSGDSGSSCEYSTYGNWLGFSCLGPDCGCHGCSVDGTYTMECSTFNLPTLFCGCSYEDPDDPPGDPPEEPFPNTPSVSITFSKPAIIFEDRYEASPDNWVEKRSTTNTLTVTASGGASGATLILSSANLECLQRIGGGSVSLPSEIVLGPYLSYKATFRCVGAGNGGSPSVGGIISGLDGTDSSYAQISVVRVDIQPQKEAPTNPCPRRHEFGIGEVVFVYQYPTAPMITVSASDANIGSASLHRIEWGVSNDVEHELTFSLNGVEYDPFVTVKKPTGIEGYDVQAETYGLSIGKAGGLKLVQRYRVLPLTVSFSRLQVEEVPCYEEIPPTGYFSYTPTNIFYRSHTEQAGAGNWNDVEEGNYFGLSHEVRDYAGIKGELPRMMPNGTMTTNTAYGWLGGNLTWKIPFGWKHIDAPSSAEAAGSFAEDTRQSMSITPTGDFSVQKLRHEAIRRIDGTITVDGNPDDGVLDN